MEELQLFATQLETLPAKVEGREAVDGLLKQVNFYFKENKCSFVLFNWKDTFAIVNKNVSISFQVEKFQTEAHKLLQEENPEGSDIESCVDFGLSLDIDLTELAQLKEKQKQVSV